MITFYVADDTPIDDEAREIREFMVELVIETIQLNKILHLPSNIEVLWKENQPDEDGMYVAGEVVYKNDLAIMVIDPSFPIHEVFLTTIHELIHLEQYKQGDLELDVLEGIVRWFGHDVDLDLFESNEDLPWERMAYSGEKPLAAQVRKIIGMELQEIFRHG